MINEIRLRFISSKQFARDKRLSHSHMRRKLRLEHVQGAVKVGRDWIIPSRDGAIDTKGLQTAKFVASNWGLSHSHMRRLLRDGKIKGIKVARDWIIFDIEKQTYHRRREKKKPRTDKVNS